MLLASWPFLRKQQLGTLQTTLLRDIQRTESLLATAGQLIQSSSGFLMYAVVAITISSFMTLCALIPAAILLLLVRPLMSRKRSAPPYRDRKELYPVLRRTYYRYERCATGVEARFMMAACWRELRAPLYVWYHSITSGSLFQPFSLIFVIVLFL